MSQNILSVWLVFHQLHSHPDRRPPQKNKRILGKLINWVDSGMAKYEMSGIDLTRSFKWFHMEYTTRVLSKFSHFRYRGSYLFQDINCLKKFSFIVHAAWKVSAFVVILVRIFPHSDWIREHSGQNNSEYGNFLRSDSQDLTWIETLLFQMSLYASVGLEDQLNYDAIIYSIQLWQYRI